MGQEAIGLQWVIGRGYGKVRRHGVGIAYTCKSLISLEVQINNVDLVYTEVGGRV